MALKAGSPILQADMAALATLANGKRNLPFDVVPMFLDNSNNKIGYRTFTNITIAARGQNYQAGYIFSIGSNSLLQVVAVDLTGGMVGIRILNSGSWSPILATPPISPIALPPVSGGGNGAVISFTSATIGPALGYSFPEYHANVGAITKIFLVNGGVNYRANETVTLPTIVVTGGGLLNLTINSVGPVGNILTWTLNNPALSLVNIPVMPVAAVFGSGTGASFSAEYTLAKNPAWLTELNRLRGNLAAMALNAQSGISGPWPGSTGVDKVFYYADNGVPQSVAITIPNLNIESFDPNWIFGMPFRTVTSLTCQVVIGGDRPVQFTGNFSFQLDGATFGAPTSGSATTDFPGAAFVNLAAANTVSTPQFTATVNPGTYTFTCTCNAGSFIHFPAVINFNSLGASSISVVVSASQATNGIHNANSIRKIICPTTPPTANGFPFGFFNLEGGFPSVLAGIALGGAPIVVVQPPLATPPPNGTQGTWFQSQIAGLATSIPGFFTSRTQMVASLNPATVAAMPWNLVRTSNVKPNNARYNPNLVGDGGNALQKDAVSNSYVQNTAVELQTEPPGWLASTLFTFGFTILSAPGLTHQVTTPGTSGTVRPIFSALPGGITTDGTVKWKTIATPQQLADTWPRSSGINVGKTVVDSNGNTQTAISGWMPNQALPVNYLITDLNNNSQMVTNPGTTGANLPAWSATLNGGTNDGTVVWKMVLPASSMVTGAFEPAWKTALGALTLDGTTFWQLTASGSRKFWPATPHRQNGGVPRYPVYWLNETIAFMKPPVSTSAGEKTMWGSGNQWQRNTWGNGFDSGWQQDNLAKGWWIYSITFNRVGSNFKNGILLPTQDVSGNVQQIAVTIGCMRNGAFVAFDTFQTGQTVQVLYPVFTSDALVYQAAERVDVQAVAIATNTGAVSLGAAAAGYPVSACFVTDTQALLGLIT